MVNYIGERFGDYQLKRLLSNRGAFADVYEGEHVIERTQAAVKVWKVHIEVKTFLNDVHAAVLIHPHIVKILDFGLSLKGDIPYLIMAYAPHGSLKGQPLPFLPTDIITYVRGIADGLFYAHQRGIVHRDIKPDNILLGPQHEIWVGDFGIATPSYTRQQEPKTQLFAGTPDYAAPEQWQGQASSASDQYALGIMVYEWLCGERPFRGDLIALYQKHTNDLPPSLLSKYPTISLAVEQVVMRTLEKYPEKRYTSVEEFALELERVYQTEQRVVSLPPVKVLSSGTLLHTYQVPQEGAYAFSWSVNGLRIASGDTEGRIAIRDIVTGNVVSLNRTLTTKVETIIWSPDGNKIASFAPEDKMIQVWNTNDGSHITTCTDVMLLEGENEHWGRVTQLIVWSPNSTLIAFRSTPPASRRSRIDPTIHIWDTHSKKCIQTFNGHILETALPKGYPTRIGVSALAWSPDNAYIASLGFDITSLGNAGPALDGWTIQVQETNTGNCITKCFFRTPPPLSGGGQMSGWGVQGAKIAWSSDGVYIAAHENYNWKGRAYLHLDHDWSPRQVQIWRALGGDEVITFPNLAAMAWSPGSTRMALANRGKTIDLWDAVSRKVITTYNKHAAAVAWSPDNKHFASTDDNGTIHIWDANSAKPILTIDNGPKAVTAMIWSPDGTQFATTSQDEMMRVWKVV